MRAFKRTIPVLAASGLILGAVSVNSLAQAPADELGGSASMALGESWLDLSATFDPWRQTGNANWRIEGDEFVADSGNGMLVTEESFEDFQIQLEFWASEGANSGVFLRASEPDNVGEATAYEVNIFDNRPDQTYRTGGVVRYAAPAVVIDTPGRWNTFDITMVGTEMKVKLNGITTVVVEDDTYASGPLVLQYGAGEVKFRNVRIKRL